MLTSHSEYGKLKEVFLKNASDSMRSQEQVNKEWQQLNFLSCPDYNLALAEYSNLEEYLKDEGVGLSYFNKSDRVSMDSMYCRDASIVTDHGIILCNMGKEERLNEPLSCGEDYSKAGFKILGQIEAPGTLEGGDVAWIDEKTLAVAHGYRTNDSGYEQLQNFLKPKGIELIQVDLPHYRGKSDVFHLMSIFSPVDKDKAVVYSPLMPVRFRELLLDRGFKLIEVPDEEFESMGCNVLAVAASKCTIVEGNPLTVSRLKEADCEVFEYAGNEISVKGGGGPTCLTRPILREI